MRKRNVGNFSGPFAPMLDIYVKQKQALGYDYIGGYNAYTYLILLAKTLK